MKSFPQTAGATRDESRPLLIGLRAAKANAVPGLIIQSAMVGVVLAYYFWAPAHGWLAGLAELKRQLGYCFSFSSGALVGGFLPEVMTVVLFQNRQVRRENFGNLLFGILYWGSAAMTVDAFYRGQNWVFGPQVDFCTVSKKVMVDQLIYTPLWSVPFGMAVFEWKNQDYSLAGMSRVLTIEYYKRKTIPAIVAGWGVWIPLVSLIYSLPPLLQIPLFSLALTFWAMLFTWINRKPRN